jgi:cytochrome c biogenesis protein CcmG, thiol:disulfide interchange protein DsbE
VRGRRLVLVAALLLAGLLAGCTSGESSAGPSRQSGPAVDPASQPCPDPGAAASSGDPALPALSFGCLGGGTLDLGRAPGVPTVVNLWASWCGPCREELPLVQQLAAAAGDRVRVVGVVSKDGWEQATSFAGDAGARFPSGFDAQGDLMTRLGLRGLPYTYFLDAEGAIAYVQTGPVASYADLRALVGDHLGVQL